VKSRDYIIFILTHGRPDMVVTYDTLRRQGYTGPVRLVVDDMDDKKEEYLKRFPDETIVFDKKKSSELFDSGDNFKTYRGVVYARNAVFDLATDLGYEFFIVLDDDYRHFMFRFDKKFNYRPRVVRNLDKLFAPMVEYFDRSGIACLAMAQGGHFIGGESSPMAEKVKTRRKLMNFFVCSTSRRFEVPGRINEDVNLYCLSGSTGSVFLTTNQVSLEQIQTQSNAGGMTGLYLDHGTYVKSFYSVIFCPSFVSVSILQDRDNARLHHKVNWRCAVPKILRESCKKIS
jgi:hypothetical protein